MALSSPDKAGQSECSPARYFKIAHYTQASKRLRAEGHPD